MKFHLTFSVAATFLFFTQTLALNHKAQVFVKRSDVDGGGNQVEVVTTLIFSGVPNSVRSSEESIAEGTSFGGMGVKVIDEIFVGNPTSITLKMSENDGSGFSKDDGVCWLRLRPVSYPVGISEYECLRQGNDGLALKWVILLKVNSFFPIP